MYGLLVAVTSPAAEPRLECRQASGAAACGLLSCISQAQLPLGMRGVSSWTRDRTRVPHIGRRIPHHWTTREVSGVSCSIHPAARPSVLPPRTYGELATWKEPMGLLPTTVAGGSVARRRESLPLRFCGKQHLLEKIVGHVAWFRLRVWCLHRPGLQSRKGNNPCKDSRQEVSSQRLVPLE